MIPELLVTIAVIFFAVMIVRDTMRQSGRWGINFKQPRCPTCNTLMPLLPKHTSLRQRLRRALWAWGDSTCPQCGLELDKWGNPVSDKPSSA
jgi:hypothetical protein